MTLVFLFAASGCVPSMVDRDIRSNQVTPGEVSGIVDNINIDSQYSYPLRLSGLEKSKIGRQIFKNETGGDNKKLIHWNVGEEFPSLGAAHFIWIPPNVSVVFGDSFKSVIQYYLSLGYNLPIFLSRLAPGYECPWRSQTEFWQQRSSPEMAELQYFLESTMNVQFDYVFHRVAKDLPKVFEGLTSSQKDIINRNILKVINSKVSWYPIVDYINFKGTGSKYLTTNSQGGWGLRQVLLAMNPNAADPAAEFSDAAYYVLHKRTEFRYQDKRWLEGWSNRVETYRDFSVRTEGF
jgi:hypothetical protein